MTSPSLTAERRAELAEAEVARLKLELERVQNDARRQLLSLMKTLGVTKDDMLAFFIKQEEKERSQNGMG